MAAGINVPKSVGITVKYTAPEVFELINSGNGRFTTEADKKIDVYAFAVTMFEVLAQDSAWEKAGHMMIIHRVNNKERPSMRPEIVEKFKTIPSLIRIVLEGW